MSRDADRGPGSLPQTGEEGAAEQAKTPPESPPMQPGNELELAAAERRYRELFERSGDIIVVLDTSGAVVFASPQWVRATGFTTQETEGKGLEQWLPARQRGVWEELRCSLAGTRETRPVALTFRARDGSDVEVEGWAMAENGPSRRLAVQLVVADVTERKSLERQKQAYLHLIEAQNLELARRIREADRSNRLKSELLAALSHELRTPINAIYGFTELLVDPATGGLNEQQAAYLGFVRSGAKHLQHLVHDILDLSRLEAGRLSLEPRQLLLAPILEEVVSVIGPLIRERDVSLECSLSPELGIYSDPVRLRQILFNLLCNAVRFSPRGGTVFLEAVDHRSRAVVTIANSGPGIPPAMHHRIFEEFQKAGGDPRGSEEGTGLGLAIVQQLIEMQGGRVWVESEGGDMGCTFGFFLPSSQNESPVAWAEDRFAAPGDRGPQILVAGTDAASRRLLVEEVRGEGYSAVEVTRIEDVPAVVQTLRPSCLILDLDGPQGEAWGALERFGADGQATAPLVLVVASRQEKKRAFLSGARGYLIKPLPSRAVSEWVRAQLPDLARGAGSVIVLMPPGPEREGVCELLQGGGFRPISTEEGRQCLRLVRELQPYATIVALHLPSFDGYQTLIRLRGDPATDRLPVIALVDGGSPRDDSPLLCGFTRVLDTGKDHWQERLMTALSEPFLGGGA